MKKKQTDKTQNLTKTNKQYWKKLSNYTDKSKEGTEKGYNP